MRIAPWALVLLALLCVTPPRCATAARVETRVLLDGRGLGDWQAVEATLTATAAQGEPALLFRVPVDWHGGEPNYPIGWPRIQRQVPATEGDWRGWDQLHLRLLGHSSAGGLPFRPFGLTVSGAGRGGWEREVPALKSDAWQGFSFDLSDLPSADRVRSQGLFISEDKYADGTTLEFFISRIELVRYTQPTLVDFAPVSGVAFADAPSLPVRVKLLGVPAGKTARVRLELRQGQRLLVGREAEAPRGETQLSLPLRRAYPTGQYTLLARLAGDSRAAPVRLVASPWQEVR